MRPFGYCSSAAGRDSQTLIPGVFHPITLGHVKDDRIFLNISKERWSLCFFPLNPSGLWQIEHRGASFQAQVLKAWQLPLCFLQPRAVTSEAQVLQERLDGEAWTPAGEGRLSPAEPAFLNFPPKCQACAWSHLEPSSSALLPPKSTHCPPSVPRGAEEMLRWADAEIARINAMISVKKQASVKNLWTFQKKEKFSYFRNAFPRHMTHL